MAPEPVLLTPAQKTFLADVIPSFSPDSWSITSAGNAGSDRRFVRIKAPVKNDSYILVVWDSSDHDWRRFLSIQKDVSAHVPFLPAIFASDDGHGLILEEDLGALTLKKYCASGAATAASMEAIYKKALDALVQWQQLDIGASATIAARDMDLEMFLWESDYFTQHCVREYFGLEKLVSAEWENERRAIAREAAGLPKVCIHRDFQSENIMLAAEKIRFVDFQGARRGPAGYDVASLLLDPYVKQLTPAFSGLLLEYYMSIAPGNIDERSFKICALQRLMQALGAFANLSIHKGKEWYRAFIPVALKRLELMADGQSMFPVLQEIVRACGEACKKKC
ncbi:MAG TPA: phosphotransferase [Chitinivibrionales bacterium]|nr:phosphotransferase [Chitinivibrionales bacterium]